jgi:hypothetical protein
MPNLRFTRGCQKPIGGEFGITGLKRKAFCDPWYNSLGPVVQRGSGRDALRSLIRGWPDRSVVVASAFTCDAVISALTAVKGLRIQLIDIGPNLYPDVSTLRREVENCRKSAIVLVGSLYGTEYPADLVDLLSYFQSEGIPVVEDRTHNIFSTKHIASDGWFASARKWVPSPGLGIYGSSSTPVRPHSLVLGFSFRILKRYVEMRLLGIFLLWPKVRNRLVSSLRKTDVKLGTGKTIVGESRFSSPNVDHQQVMNFLRIRQINAETLKDCLHSVPYLNLLNSEVQTSYFTLTFRCSAYRDELRAYLRDRSIYAPVLWPVPESFEKQFPKTHQVSKSVLSIPIDQRYSINDMTDIANAIIEFYDQYPSSN